MRVVSSDQDEVIIGASAKELAILYKFLDWISTERKYMDGASLLMEEDEIYPSLRIWLDFLAKEAVHK